VRVVGEVRHDNEKIGLRLSWLRGNRARPVRAVSPSARPPSRPSANRSASTTTNRAWSRARTDQNRRLGDRRAADLPTRFVKIVVTDDQGRYVVPEPAESDVQRVGARLRAGGFAEFRTAPGKIVNLKSVVAPNAPRRANTIAIYGTRCSRFGQERVSRHGPRRQRHPGDAEEPGPVAGRRQDQRLLHCHQLGTRRRARSRRIWATSLPRRRRGARIVSGQAMTQMTTTSAGSTLGVAWRCSPPTGPIRIAPASCGLQADAGPRGSSATSSSLGTGPAPRTYLHDEASTDKRNPQVNANGLIYGRPRRAGLFPVLDPVSQRRPR